jgi:catechol 2,3-dioxygenase-like lactoylglutathione lyase family enzyme
MRAEFRTDHAAFLTWDTAKTHDFYTRVMGWPLAVAFGNHDADPPWFITGYDAGGWNIEFEEIVGTPAAVPQPAPAFPHFGLAAADAEELAAWKLHLDECGLRSMEMGNEVFFGDPNGITFQVFVPTDHGTPEERRAKSEANLAAWLGR